MANKKEAYISFRCSEEIKKKLETECRNKEWTMSHTVEKIIKQYFEKEAKREYANNCTKCTFLLIILPSYTIDKYRLPLYNTA